MRGGRDDALPVYTFEIVSGVPPVSVLRFDRRASPGGLPPGAHPHSHEFLVLTCFERDGGSLRLGDREWRIEAGDAYAQIQPKITAAIDRALGTLAITWTPTSA